MSAPTDGSGIAVLLSRLRELDVCLWVEDDRLRYSAPRGKLAPDLRAELAARKEEILRFLRQARGAVVAVAPPIVAGARGDGPPPLSFAQQRLWFSDRFEPGSALYNVASILHLTGRLDPGALARALGEIVRRHEALRTTFELVAGDPAQGGPVQVIHPARALPLPMIDLAGLGDRERQAITRRLAGAEARWPFDLARGPLLRVVLLRLGNAEHALLITVHHIIFDGWSSDVFRRELGALYQAFIAGRPSPLAELPVQYADFVGWQRQWLAGPVLAKLVAYWRGELAGLPPLELPTDRPRPMVRTFRGTTADFRLPARLSRRLHELSRQEGSTLFMTLLAAFQVLMGRHGGQQDLAVGTPIANRNRAEIEGLIGFFVNTLVVRGDLAGDPTFRQLLARVRGVALGAYAHQDLPFEQLVEELEPERNLAQHPLVQVLFALRNASAGPRELAPGVNLMARAVLTGTAKFDLTLDLEGDAEELMGALEYTTDLFDPTTARRILAHYRNLLTAIVDDPERRLSQLPLVSAPERHQLVLEWNDGRTEYPREASIPRLFELQARRSPEAVAVVYADQSLTYQELNRRANQLAHHLRALGVGPDVPAAIYLERSLSVVLAVLGILKAGGAYLPLDRSYPMERLALMLEDAAAPVLVTVAELAARLPAALTGSGLELVCLDRDAGAIARRCDHNPEPSPAMADHLAYLIYTSGSTGRPKGVAVPHRAVARLVFNTNYVDLGPGDRVAQASNTSFDAATFELWGALLRGARLVGIGRDTTLDPGRFAAAIRERGITALFLTTALFNQMARENPAALRRVRQLLFGGEAVDPRWVREALEDGRPGGPCCGRLLHVYGPTESTTFATWHRVREVPPGAWTVPIGGPISNTEIYVLDRSFGPVPVGVGGELCIGGDGLARAYLDRPALTAERFVPDPYRGGGRAGGRLYRTGDLVRYRADGRIEFLGRLDHQVKLRGFRIELGEIETVLAAHPAVAAAAVVAAPPAAAGGAGQERLVAFAVRGEGAGELDAGALRAYLGKSLPEYMVPAVVLFLDALPLTPNGKVDRLELGRRARSERPGPQDEESFVAPQTPLEKLVAAVWSEVLAVDRVGLGDNFFALGGHSLLATQVFSRLNEALASELPLAIIFEAANLGELAARIEEILSRQQGGRETIGFLEIRRRDPAVASRLPLSFSQERLWLLDRLEPGSTAYNLPFPARLVGELDAAVLERAIGEIVRRHESLRTTFASSEADDGPIQVVAPPQTFRLPVVDLSRLAAPARRSQVATLVHADARRPFDLAQGPLYRAALLRLEATEHALLQNMHHVISDGWSIGVIFRELAALLAAFSAGRRSPLAELPIQYADFALWQRERLRGERLQRQLAYWTAQLGGSLPVLELPTDRPRPAFQTHRGAQERSRLPATLTAALHELSHHHGASLFMTLLAAFKVLLYRYTGQEDVIVGAPIAGRQRVEVEGLIGFFLNTLALRTQLQATISFDELLARVRSVVLGATAHQEVPFEKLLEELEPERTLSHSPVFQVFFNMINLPALEFELPGLKAEGLEVGAAESKFDFTLYVEEVDGEIRFDLVYNVDLFDRARMTEMLAQYAGLLAQIVAAPAAAIGSYALVTAGAEKLLPDPAAPLPAHCEETLMAGFARQAAQRPDRPAVVDDRETWSYGELDRRSNQLAHHLLAAGVKRQEVVAVWAHRSASLVWALLGILKAGAAFLILDPAYPAARLREYVRQARPRGWLEIAGAGEPPAELPAAFAGCRLRLPERSAAEGLLNDQPAGDPGIPVDADDLAYVAFTSGSTGEPKGILGRHGPLTHFLPWLAATFALDRDDRHSLLSALSHDPLHRDVFMPLWYGATICVPDPEAIGTPGYLADWVRRRRLTVLNLTPAMLRILCQGVPEGTLDTLRWAFLIGDVLTRDEVRALYALAPSVGCVNYYGSTETQRSVSYYLVERATVAADGPSRAVLPVGRGIGGVQLLVLNPAGRLAGIGELGEIHFRSRHLARGYLGDEALTRERFVANPFTAVHTAGDRLYRTGDLGRYLPDGNVEFLGRADRQVKIRGFRIELGEIEAALDRHPAVRECTVGLRGKAGDRRLVAWVVARGERPGVGELRDFLGQRLPDYMVPSAWVFLDALPLTRTGKLDRAALPEPEARQAELLAAFAPPRSGEEEMLAAIWSDVLGLGSPGVPRVGVHDNFFALGGHSLLATQLLSRVRDAFGVELPLRRLFEGPTVAAMAAALAAGREEGPEASPIRPADRDDHLPLSFAQQRLWFIDCWEPGTARYNMSTALRLSGRLDVAALARALDEIARRHEVLRTVFETADGEPVQVIRPAPTFDPPSIPPYDKGGRPRPSQGLPLPIVDLTALPEAKRRSEAERLIHDEARRPFDLTRGPVARAGLARLGGRQHLLLLTVHHIAFDGWSTGVFLRELTLLYEAFSAGRASPLAELSVQYADFAVWQRQWLAGEVLARQLAYWRRQLADLPVLELPTDRPRPAVLSFRGAIHPVRLSGDLLRRLEELGRRSGSTLYMTLLAAFQVLLARYAVQDDLAVGSPIANRNRTEIEGLLGFFVNTLALRGDLSGDPVFGGPPGRTLLARVREVALEAYAHQDLPFEKLVEELDPERDLSQNPLVQVFFVLQNAPAASWQLGPGLTVAPLAVSTGEARFDLTLALGVEEAGEGLTGGLEYNTDLFDPTTARRILAHYRNLLTAIVDDPEQRLSQLSLLSPGESHELMREWNDSRTVYPRSLPVHEAFAARAAERPAAPAVVASDEVLTYGELDRRANRLAHALVAWGVGPDVPVGILMERSPALVVAVVGILKAGGAYLPIDPASPPERLAYMLDDAGVSVILTRESLRQELGEVAGRVVVMDGGGWEEGSDKGPAGGAGGDNLAYVIYTSGSTGRPKGTELAHAGLVNLVHWHRELYAVTAADRATQLAGPGFDAAVWELWPYLTAGAAIYIPEPEIVAVPKRLLAWLAGAGITLCFLPTPLAEAVLCEPLPPGLALRALLTGGDRLRQYPDPDLPFALVNHYGPTEGTVVTTATAVAPRRPGDGPPPIGRPLPNVRTWLLDGTQRPVPIGVAGELYVGGAGLARGYLGRPRLTAECFIPNPFCAGERLYRTGDLARYLTDGRIEFLGRIDHQVKIRGFRIELGEIETVLAAHPAVVAAAVVAAPVSAVGAGDERLVAFAVRGEGAGELDAGALRAYLGTSLPEYMVPGVVVLLDALPLTPNGKVDRRELGRWARSEGRGPQDEEAFVAPRGPEEEVLAAIWAEIFGEGAGKIGAHDDFFALGGHSLLAIRVVSRIRTTFDVELPLAGLFEAPTVAGLAAQVQELTKAGGEPVPAIERVPRDGDLPLSFAQERLWFLDRYEPDSPVYNIPGVYQLTGPLSPAALAASLRAVVRRHETLRTTFREGPRQHVAADVRVDLPLVDLGRLPAAARSELAAALAGEQSRRTFDLAAAPLLRAALLRLGEKEHRLLLTLHHIISDGWSMEVLARELTALYRAFTSGPPPTTESLLPELPIQYADFASWQRRWLQGPVLERQLAYWRQTLAGAATALELPTDRPRPPLQTASGAARSRPLPAGLSDRLEALGREQGSTLFITLLAALFALLHRYTGQQDLLVGSPVANRGLREIEGLIGFFVNTLVLRADLAGGTADRDPTFYQLLSRVRAAALGAYAHQDLPFERLVEELQPERDLSRTPLFQVMFVLNQAPLRWEGEGASPLVIRGDRGGIKGREAPDEESQIRALGVDNRTAKFDLTFQVAAAGGELVVAVTYNTDLFDGVTIDRLLGHFERLLEAIVEAPAQPHSALPLLARGEEHALLVEWNDTAFGAGPERCVHELFDQQAAGRPQALAVADRNGALSYGELGRRAGSLARDLRRRGVGPEVVVALCLERSAEMLVAMLGILKAGGAYLPLDPDYPAERLAFMLADSRAPVVLTQERLAARVREALPEPAPEVIVLTPRPSRPESGTGTGTDFCVGAENLAYVIYTSGSTGRPKGVEIRHSGLRNLVRWHQRTYALTPADRATQVAGLSFDASVREIWPYLTAGASLHIPDQETRTSPARLVSWLARQAITLGFQPTPIAEALLSEPWPPGTALRALLTGGDRLHRRPGSDFPGLLANHYGPTENTVVTTAGAVRPGAPGLPTIGRPIANTAVYVVDRKLRPVPLGVAGELVTRGAGLARGYARRPALSAESFLPDPFGAPREGGRLYRTGDLVRWRPDGRVEFLGRIDHQVKIRGIRIELGEIEVVLGHHPAVTESAVVTRQDPTGGQRLVAWIVPAEGSAPSDAELRRFVAEKLPDNMVPAVFAPVEALPLLPNGKIDRAALGRRPLPERARLEPEGASRAPRSPAEEALVEIWAEVLKRDRIGIHDDFFELGGHSLLATQVLSRVRQTLGVEPPVRTLFEHPTVAGLAAWVTAARRREEGLEVPPIRPVERCGHPPLAFAQQRLWFLDRFEPGSALYNVPHVLHLAGRLDPGALGRALGEIVRRHEVLRTTFETVDGEPVQVICPMGDGVGALPMVDLAGLGDPERRAEARRLAAAEAWRAFDLVRGPLLRLRLLRLGSAEHVLVATVHHIVFDGWSAGVFQRELGVLYTFFAGDKALGGGGPLPELPVQYADFAVWQRQWLAGRVLAKQLAYWRDELAGLPVLQLPTDRPRPALQSFSGATLHFPLAANLSRRIRTLGRESGSTLFMTLLAAFQLLLGRYGGQRDLAVGTPIANRGVREIEGLIGFFVNTLVLRGDLSGDPTVRALLARVRDAALGAYAHQDLPFEQLVEELDPERNLSQNPLVQVLFIFQNAPQEAPELGPELTLEPWHVGTSGAKFDLTLTLGQVGDELRGGLEYNTDLFDATTIRRLIAHLRSLLSGLAADPERRLSQLPLLAAGERQQLLREWNDRATAVPSALIDGLFAARAAATPAATAVVWGEEWLSYGELDRRSNQLAHHLRARGVGPDVLVGICMERSAAMVAAILGVLKAGGAYLPLDPGHPEERLSYVLADGRARLLLTQDRLRGVLPPGPEVVCPDREQPAIAARSPLPPPATAGPDNLAYVIYTSGTTGRPKGVAISHRTVVNFLASMRRQPGLGSGDRLLAVTTLTFDIAVLELLLPLTVGARVEVASREQAADGRELASLVASRRITALQGTPATWRLLLAASWGEVGMGGGVPPCHKGGSRGDQTAGGEELKVLCGGEALPRELARRLLDRTPELWNLYGPTETTVWSAVDRVGPGTAAVSIGRPIAETEIHLLDADLRPVPLGVAGRLHVGGAGLARGYHQRPALTAEKFIPNPFAVRAGERLYDTGDLARHLPDGKLDCLGRRDHQVKVRGFRIELGEIEAVLGDHPGIRECAVAVRETAAGDHQLGAWMVAGDQRPSRHQLREFLGRQLPEYMVPSAWVFLDALPLTPSGKVDRAALPEPEERRPELLASFVPPRSGEEEMLAAIWAQVLAVPRVGAHDNFFDLGGHSLLATQLLSRVRDAFGVDLPLRRVFEAPTVAALAAALVADRSAAGPPQPPLRPVPREGDLPLSFAQERLWFLDRLEPGSSAYVLSGALRLGGPLDLRALAASLGELVRRHETLRTSFPTVAGEARQVIAPPAPAVLPMVDLGTLPAAARQEETARLATREAARPFDLARGPLLRTTLLRLAAEEHALLVSMHHVISDGWSIGLLVRELTVLYEAFTQERGGPSLLAELPVQYADFAHWERQWLQGEVLEAQLAYWRQQLAGAPPVLELPADRPRPAIETFRGARRRVGLPASLTAAVRELGRRHGVTPFMTLLAAFKVLLSRHAGELDVVVGTPIAHRGRTELEPLIGLFANTLVLRTVLTGDPCFAELCRRVREVALGAYAHQDMPFEKLVDELRPRRDLSHSPLFQVLFILQNVPLRAVPVAGLTVEALEVEVRRAQFDLTLTLVEGAEEVLGALDYNTDLFDPTTAERLARRFRLLVEGAVAAPDRAVSELPLMAASERRQLLGEWNDTESPSPAGCLHDLFAEQARRTPEATAVAMGETWLSYRRLDDESDRLAAHLRALGAGPEVLVAVMSERRCEMVVALLAILKAGAAYLPLGASFPRDRLAFMLDDARAPLILVQEELRDRLPPHHAREVTLALPVPSSATALPPRPSSPDHLAYLLYTSGTTGRPKGVAVTHRTVVNFLASMRREPGLTSRDRLLAVTTLTFDIAVLELFLPLTVGARVVVASREQAGDGKALAGLVASRGITALQGTPATWRLLLEAGWPEGVEELKVLCGGEAIPRELAGRLLARSPELWNLYGPTETTVWSAVHPVAAGPAAVPVGRPIANTRIHLLDPRLRPVPLGVAGELHIGGAGLARGYHGRPALTAEKFLPDPFAARPGQRLYNTGDLARHLADGRLDFLGRRDHQVKVRGFRIELREIEIVLAEHPDVAQAAVVARPDAAGDQRLVAYVVSRDEPVASGELRGFLGERLPDYMVPSLFVDLAVLPLSASGKVDRRALPEPEVARGELRGVPVAPRDHLELVLTRIWEELLGVSPIGVRDNFFELGGHSLSAVRLVARIQQELGRDLPLTALFRGATVEQLAGLLRREAEPALPSCLVPIRTGGSWRPLFCVHPAGGNVLCYLPLARELGPEQPFYAFQSRGLDGDEEPLTSIEEMAAHYLTRLREVQPQGPYQLTGWSFGGLVAYEMARQLAAGDHEVALLALVDVAAPSDRSERRDEAIFADDAFWLADVAAFLARLAGREPAISQDELRRVAGPEQVGFFVARMEESGDLAPGTSAVQVRRLLRVYKTNVRASWSYLPLPYPGRMTLLRAASGPGPSADPTAASGGGPGDPALGWGRLCSLPVEVHTVSGTHLTVLAPATVGALAERLRSCLESVRSQVR